MTPQQFIDKWSRVDRTERQAAQEHFIDLCRVLGEPTPNEADDSVRGKVAAGRAANEDESETEAGVTTRLNGLGCGPKC